MSSPPPKLLSDWELWACANKMIEDHGADAAIQAAMKGDKLLWNGDIDGAANWRAIVHRIEQLEGGSSRPH